MKRIFVWTAIGLLATATTLPAQRGRGGQRGNNGGGICDGTARRIGQARGPGNGCRGANCPGMQQGTRQQQQQQQQQPPAKK